MESIKYVIGDATEPVGDGRKLIIHCCNDIGAWGRGFVLAVSKKWQKPEQAYREWYKRDDFKLGRIQAVKVEDDIAVVNMIGQRHIKALDGIAPVRYRAIENCLAKVADIAERYDASVHCPYLMCCDLAGGEWDRIEKMLQEIIVARGISVTAYDFNNVRKDQT